MTELLRALFQGLVFSIFRGKDGQDIIPRDVTFMGMSIGLIVLTPELQFIGWEPFVAAGLLVLTLVFGWGEWFCCVSGKYHKKPVKWYGNPVNWVLHKIFDRWGPDHPYSIGTFCMSIRWWAYSLPFFCFMDFGLKALRGLDIMDWTNSFALLAVGPIYYLSGLFYRTFFILKRKYDINTAEYISGYLYGFVSSYSAVFGFLSSYYS